jgi:predicted aspartyl protease
MGLTTLRVRLSNPRDRRRAVEEELLVDSGAIYAVVPAPVLRRIGVRPSGSETFTLADGTHVTREVGTVFFELDGREGASKVVFGRRGDARLIGAVALEELGLMLDPLKRELRPLRLMLARVVSTTGEAPFPSAHQP